MYIRRTAVALLTIFHTFALAGGELLEKVAENMGMVKSIQCEFKQEKHLKNFAFPLKISGVMCADQNHGRFAWRVEKPMISNCIITGKKLVQFDGDTGKTVELSADKNPALKMLSDTLKVLFAGDIKAMLKDFSIVQEKNPMTLTPRKNSQFAMLISSVTFTFSDDLRKIKQIVLTEKSGDFTRIVFFNTSINTPIRESLWQPASVTR